MTKPPASRKQCLVLLVGDSSEGYELHSEILARAGYAVAGAEGGDEAYQMALKLAPDLIVLDFKEGKDVNAATRKLKSDPRTAPTPMLLLTGHVTSRLYETVRAGSAGTQMAPPTTYDKMLEEVNKHFDGDGGSVLIIEDEEDIRITIADILDNAGLHVITASDGREAIEWLRRARNKPRVILLDLMMPVMDGWTFRAEQLAVPELASIPVVILSAATDLSRWAGELHVAEFLAKPIDLPRLLSAVERHV